MPAVQSQAIAALHPFREDDFEPEDTELELQQEAFEVAELRSQYACREGRDLEAWI